MTSYVTYYNKTFGIYCVFKWRVDNSSILYRYHTNCCNVLIKYRYNNIITR